MEPVLRAAKVSRHSSNLSHQDSLKSLIGRDINKYNSVKLFEATLPGSLTVLRLTLLSYIREHISSQKRPVSSITLHQLSCFPAVCLRWTCSSLSSLSCSSRSTPPETSRASVWPTTTSSVTCSPSPSSCWSRYQSHCSNYVGTSSTVEMNLLSLTKTVCSLLSSGVSLSERDPRAVSQLLLSGQPDGGVAGRERNCSAGHPGQGETLLMSLLISLMM